MPMTVLLAPWLIALFTTVPVNRGNSFLRILSGGKGQLLEEKEYGNERIQMSIRSARQKLIKHALYSELNSVHMLRCFMEHHVFCVLDFMSLVKRLQNEFTTLTVPWTPENKDRGNLTRFLNEIVLDEESDDVGDGQNHESHFMLYIRAMEGIGADTRPALDFCRYLESGMDIDEALHKSGAPAAARTWTSYSLHLAMEAPVAAVGAAFTFGREDIIPEMFAEIVQKISSQGLQDCHDSSLDFGPLIYYLNRHIELDGDTHGPLSLKMMETINKDDVESWRLAEAAALEAIEQRNLLWSGIRRTYTPQIRWKLSLLTR